MASIQQSIEVNVPAQTAYAALSEFSAYPRFMQGVDEIRQTDANHLHWRMSRDGKTMEWDSELIEQTPPHTIAWRNSGAPTASGRILLSPQDADRTRVTLTMEFMPERLAADGISHEDCIAMMNASVGQDLAHFKTYVEALPNGGVQAAGPGRHAADEAHARSASGYATGSEEWDGNEDPGTPVISSSRNGGASGQTSARAEVGVAGAASAKAGGAQAGAAARSGDERAAFARTDGAAHANAGRSDTPAAGRGEAGAEHGAAQEGKEGTERAPSWMPNILRAWEEPFVAMRRMTDEMDQLFEKFVGRPMAAVKARAGGIGGIGGDWSPQIEVAQSENQLLVSADIPGVRREHVQVEIQGDRLIIEGERFDESGASGGTGGAPSGQDHGVRHSERSYGHFYRAIVLPSGADGDAASASMQDGILRVVVPLQTPPRQSRKVDIRS